MHQKKPIKTLASYAADSVMVLNEGRKVFGSAAKLEVWLNTPQKELGDQSPAKLLFSAEGTAAIMEELARIKEILVRGDEP